MTEQDKPLDKSNDNTSDENEDQVSGYAPIDEEIKSLSNGYFRGYVTTYSSKTSYVQPQNSTTNVEDNEKNQPKNIE